MAAALAVALLVPAAADAHRLDEYLQATRVALGRGQVVVELDLTPGASVASAIVALIDRDGDRTISPAEIEAYGRSVVGDLTLTLDDRPVSLVLSRIDAPTIGEMSDGMGTIRLRAAGRADDGTGRRELFVRNDHSRTNSVYMINAMMPDDRDTTVVAQVRDPRQSTAQIEYRIDAPGTAQLGWVLLAIAGLSVLVTFRRRQAAGDSELDE
jgi:hypothetical protein